MLDTYANLQAAIADHLNRDDLATQIVDFITLTEAQIQRRVRRKTVRNTAFTIAAESTPVPNDCAEVRYLIPQTGIPSLDVALPIGTVATLAAVKADNFAVAGRPQAATIVDGNIIISPPPDASYTFTIVYYQKLVPLSNSNTTNLVLAEAPDIYLYGALLRAAPYLEHDERIQIWQAFFETAVAELDDKRQREETAAQPNKARLPVSF